MVKNEQDIIEPFVRHNLRFLDALVIADNGSVDSTRDILVSLGRELDGLVIGDIPEFGYTQAVHMTHLLHAAQAAFFAEYIILIDADEFIDTPDRESFLTSLSAIPSAGVGLIPWRTHVLVPTDLAAQIADPPRSIRWRRVEERPQFCKVALRPACRTASDFKVEQGNHGVVSTIGEAVPSVVLEGLALQHFPVRGRDQLMAKCVVGWMAYLAKDAAVRANNAGFQWREIAERIAAGNELSDAELANMSLCYAQDPDWVPTVVPGAPPSDYQRRYSAGSGSAALTLIVRSWAQSLIAPTALLEIERPADIEAMASHAVGAFAPTWHWDNLFVDVPPFRALAERHRLRSVLDIGCGVGAYLRLFRELGAEEVFGVDGLPADATAVGATEYRFHDLSEPLELGRKYDLVMCTEVVEHLDSVSADAVIDTIARHALDLIVFSAAEPGQPGHGHVNCRPLLYWLALWRPRGWLPIAKETMAVRALASLSWFRRNLIVLRRRTANMLDGTAVLEAIAARPFTWYDQQPGIRQVPFLEEMPAGCGYSSRA